MVWTLLVLVAGGATAREGLVLPVSCQVQSDRIILQPSPPTAYEIVSEREREVFSVCRPGGPSSCRPILVYRFDVACGAERVPWMEFAAALLSAGGTRAWIRDDRLRILPPAASGLGQCDSPDPAFSFMKACDPWTKDRPAEWVLPPGYAPVHEVGARFIELPPAPEPPQRQPEPEPPAPVVAETAEPELQPAEPERAAEPVAADTEAAPETPAPETEIAEPDWKALEPDRTRLDALAKATLQASAPAEPDETAVANTDSAPEPISSAPPPDPEPLEASTPDRDLRMVPVTGWSSSVTPAREESVFRLGLQFLTSLEHLAAPVLDMLEQLAIRARTLPQEKEFSTLMMGVALLSCLLFSGIGWYSVRTRRVRAEPTFGMAEPQSMHFSPSPSPGTALVASDEKMCGELCRTAHTMLQQIDARVDELQGVAPLRRVLQREMRNLEQFLTAVMTASPREPEEWRRMRNRLQRIVKELHRLRDIVEGAYRSLSAGGFTSREPPRDKYEAYEALGVNPDVSPRTLKKLVDALRACWHPDLAKDERDRQLREERMKRINIAWDIITSKRQEA